FDHATPLQVKAALVGALAYFVLPFDAIPDALPLVGFTDDAAVLLTALRMVAGHMRAEHREAARAALARMKAGRWLRRSALPICYSPRAIGALGEACASYPHHQLAHHLAVRERLERGRRLGEWIDLLDVARQLALRAPMGERSDGGLVVLLVVA